MLLSVKHIASIIVIASLLSPSLALAVDSKKASYFGGTVTAFAGAKNPIEGTLDTTNETTLDFAAEDKPFKGQSVGIPYANIVDLEYGQKAGRRVGAAVGTAVLLGPLGLLTLFSHKRNHYLTVGFKDGEDKDQVAVFEIGKDIIRTTIAVVQTRSGKTVTFQDDEARKSGLGK
jgi:hypothetical protein